MWLGVRQAFVALASAYRASALFGACSGGYPLPPTACDEYCNATLGNYCPDWYDPANCVAECEQQHAAPPECRAELDALIGCYKDHPNAPQERCSFDPNRLPSCAGETLTLQICANPDQYSGLPGYPSRE